MFNLLSAVKNVEDYLTSKGEKFQAKAPTPLLNGYFPQIDLSPEWDAEEAVYFHLLIRVLRWIVELNIDVVVSMMLSHLALPQMGHLKEVLHIFAHSKKHHNLEMVFDPMPVDYDRSLFEKKDWSFSPYGYGVLTEELPARMSVPPGPLMNMRVYVDSNHTGDLVAWQSRTGFDVFLNNAPIYWSSKKQTMCETSTFGSKFMVMKQATKYVWGLCFKLGMMAITVDEPAFVLGDN